MAGAWGKLQRRHPERGSATLQADDAASARASARGSPLRAAQTRRPALPGGGSRRRGASVGPHAAGARGTGPGRPQRSREAAPDRACRLGRREMPAASTSGRTLQRCSVPAPALAIGRSGSAAGGTSALQRTCGSRTDRMGTALPAAWPLVRARCRICVHSDSGPDAPAASRLAEPPRGTAGAFSTHP